MNSNEEIPYRPFTNVLPDVAQVSTTNEANFDSLRVVRKAMADSIADLDKWHAFDLEKTDTITLKQQIVAHRLAYEILIPALDALDSAIESVNRKNR